MTFVSRLRDAWSLQPPGSHITDPSGTLGAGVMDYHGSNDDRRQAGHEHTRTDPSWGEVL